MKLYLVRHGEAKSAPSDDQRELSEQGREDVIRISDFLKRADVTVDAIYHSPKKRAQQTAEIIKNTIFPQGQLTVKEGLKPNDPTDEIVYEVSQSNESLMIVGHLPFLPRLISHLVVGDEDKTVIGMATSSVVAMYRDAEQRWQIVWVVSPELI